MSQWSGKIPKRKSLSISDPFKIQINNFVAHCRNSSKRSLVKILTKNLALNLSGSLFLVGVGCSLRWWYKDQLGIALLKQNLPALSESQQKTSWETGEYVLKEQNLVLQHLEKNAILHPLVPKVSTESKPKTSLLLTSERDLAEQDFYEEKYGSTKRSMVQSKDKSVMHLVDNEDIPNPFRSSASLEKEEAPLSSVSSLPTLRNKQSFSLRSSFPVPLLRKEEAEEAKHRKLWDVFPSGKHRLLERVDLYMNHVVVKFKSPWQKHAYHRFVGLFSEPTQVKNCKIDSNCIKGIETNIENEVANEAWFASVLPSLCKRLLTNPFLTKCKPPTLGSQIINKKLISKKGDLFQNKVSTYTTWKPLFPKTWFKLSAHDLCLLTEEFPHNTLQPTGGGSWEFSTCFRKPIVCSLISNLPISQYDLSHLRKPFGIPMPPLARDIEGELLCLPFIHSFRRIGSNPKNCLHTFFGLRSSSASSLLSNSCFPTEQVGKHISASLGNNAEKKSKGSDEKEQKSLANSLAIEMVPNTKSAHSSILGTKLTRLRVILGKSKFSPLKNESINLSAMHTSASSLRSNGTGKMLPLLPSEAQECKVSLGLVDPSGFKGKKPPFGKINASASQGSNTSKIRKNKPTLLKKLSYPLELTKIMDGWQPPNDALILNSYLDEIPYKLESTLPLFLSQKLIDNQIVHCVNIDSQRDIQQIVLSAFCLQTSPSLASFPMDFKEGLVCKQNADNFKGGVEKGSHLFSLFSSPEMLKTLSFQESQRKQSKEVKHQNHFLPLQVKGYKDENAVSFGKSLFNKKEQSETFLRKSQLLEMKQVLKNELQFLINQLSLAVVSKSFSSKQNDVGTNLMPQPLLVSLSAKQRIRCETRDSFLPSEPKQHNLSIPSEVAKESKGGLQTLPSMHSKGNNPFDPKEKTEGLHNEGSNAEKRSKDAALPLLPVLPSEAQEAMEKDRKQNTSFVGWQAQSRGFSRLSNQHSIEGHGQTTEDLLLEKGGKTLGSNGRSSISTGSAAYPRLAKNQQQNERFNPFLLLNKLGFTFNNLSFLNNPPMLLPVNSDASFWMWKLPLSVKEKNHLDLMLKQKLLSSQNKTPFVQTPPPLLSFRYEARPLPVPTEEAEPCSLAKQTFGTIAPSFSVASQGRSNRKGRNAESGDLLPRHAGKRVEDCFTSTDDTIFQLHPESLIWKIYQQPTLHYCAFFSGKPLACFPRNAAKVSTFPEEKAKESERLAKPRSISSSATPMSFGVQNCKEKIKGNTSFSWINCAHKIFFQQKKTTIANTNSINLVDKEVNFASKRSRFMSGYVYSDTQSQSLKTNIYQWLAKNRSRINEEWACLAIPSSKSGRRIYEANKAGNLENSLEAIYPQESCISCFRKNATVAFVPKVRNQSTEKSQFKLGNYAKRQNSLRHTHNQQNEMYWFFYPESFRESNRLADKACLSNIEIQIAPTTFLLRFFQKHDPDYQIRLGNATVASQGRSNGSEGTEAHLAKQHKRKEFEEKKQREFFDSKAFIDGCFLPLEHKAKAAIFDFATKQAKEDNCATQTFISKNPSVAASALLRKQSMPSKNWDCEARSSSEIKSEQPFWSKGKDQTDRGTKLTSPIDVTSGFTKLSSNKIALPYEKFNHHLTLFPGFSQLSQFFVTLPQISQGEDLGYLSTRSFSYGRSNGKEPLLLPFPTEEATEKEEAEQLSFGTSVSLGKQSIAPQGRRKPKLQYWDSDECLEVKDDSLLDLQQKDSKESALSNIANHRKIASQAKGLHSREEVALDAGLSNPVTNSLASRMPRGDKFLVDCNDRGTAYRGIGVQRNKLTKDLQPFKEALIQSSIWGMFFLGPENPVTDRQCHFFGQKQLSTLDTTNFQRDYLRQLGKEIVTQSNAKGFTEKLPSIERAKILSFSKTVSSFFFKKRKYTYLLGKKDQWHLLFQEQLRTALEDTRKYPLITPESSYPLLRNEASQNYGPGRIKVSAPLIMTRFPKEITKASLPNLSINKKAWCCTPFSIAPQERSNGERFRLDAFLRTHHYPLFSERQDFELNNTSYFGLRSSSASSFSIVPQERSNGSLRNNGVGKHKISLLSFFNVANNRQWLIQEPLTANSWAVISQWFFLVALLFWIEQMLLEKVFPALFALEQVLLGATGIKTGDRTHVIRVSRPSANNKPKFQDLAGVDGLLGELSELVLFLRGHKERFWNKKSSYGVLLTGPPGAGKTFLVRALANEAGVPVLILSAGTLVANKLTANKPSWSIRHAFRRAKQLAPCILFIDEIDALGKSRGKIVTDIDEIVASSFPSVSEAKQTNFNSLVTSHQNQSTFASEAANTVSPRVLSYEQSWPGEAGWPSVSKLLLNEWEHPLNSVILQESNEINRCSLCEDKLFDLLGFPKTRGANALLPTEAQRPTLSTGASQGMRGLRSQAESIHGYNQEKTRQSRSAHSNADYVTSGGNSLGGSGEDGKRKFGPLTQLLVSMDGVSNLSGVLIMGATNRPELLDSALTRPGRFERIIRVEKPSEQKRIEILQLYSHNLGIQHQIPWHYLANRTRGLTAADLAVAMNYSSLKAIIQGSAHTIETIEYGLNSITRFSHTPFNSSSSKAIISPRPSK